MLIFVWMEVLMNIYTQTRPSDFVARGGASATTGGRGAAKRLQAKQTKANKRLFVRASEREGERKRKTARASVRLTMLDGFSCECFFSCIQICPSHEHTAHRNVISALQLRRSWRRVSSSYSRPGARRQRRTPSSNENGRNTKRSANCSGTVY